MVETGFSITTNNFGVEHKNINRISKKFIDDSLDLSAHSKVLDIGSAYGVAVLPIISGNPNVTIIACDICPGHLNHIKNYVKNLENEKNNLLSRLILLEARFPEFDLEESSLNSVLASHILPFLSGDEFEVGLMKLSKFLKRDGKLYITSYSIYNNLMKDYYTCLRVKEIKR